MGTENSMVTVRYKTMPGAYLGISVANKAIRTQIHGSQEGSLVQHTNWFSQYWLKLQESDMRHFVLGICKYVTNQKKKTNKQKQTNKQKKTVPGDNLANPVCTKKPKMLPH